MQETWRLEKNVDKCSGASYPLFSCLVRLSFYFRRFPELLLTFQFGTLSLHLDQAPY